MMPEASVIIPTYNRRMMVREAAESVLRQRGTDFELVVVDDGSTDGTFAELEALAAAFNRERPAECVRVVRLAHRGPAAARNHGGRLARGEFIAFLDSDDLWMPDKLRRQLAFMRANPFCSISQTQETWLRLGRRVNPARRHRKRGGDFFIASLRTCLVSPSSVILRTDLFRATGGFDEAMTACEDYDLWLRILAEHEVGLLDEALVVRRAGHPDQLSAMIPALDRFRILALLKLIATPNLAPDRRAAVCEALREKCAIYAQGLERRGWIDRARRCREIAAQALDGWLGGSNEGLAEAIAVVRALLSTGGPDERSDRVARDQLE